MFKINQSTIVIIISIIQISYALSFKIDKLCHMDKQCIIYNDCCTEREKYAKSVSLKNILSCKLFNKMSASSIWVINRCNDTNHKFSDYCLKNKTDKNNPLKSHIPVISKSNLIYENQFCAKCNNESKFKYLNVNIECNLFNLTDYYSVSKAFLNDSDKCSVSPFFNKSQQRNCGKIMIEQCPLNFVEKNTSISENCEFGKKEIVSYNNKLFRNPFCCSCWNFSCYSSFNVRFLKPPYKFSYLLNFNEWEEESTETLSINSTGNVSVVNNITSNLSDEFVFYISFTFTCISLVSLSFLIILYTTLKTFRNFGGYLTVCLSICLWFVNFISLLVATTKISHLEFCRYLAIPHHFMALSTFIWMAVYALDLLQTFGIKSTNVTKKKSCKTFGFYCIIGFSCSGLIVLTSSLLEFTRYSNSTITPHYGGSNCWFTNKIGGLIWYFIPVCLLLLWNFVSCIFVFYRLMTTAKECRIIKNNERNSTLWLCIRLTAVFGIGYFFQIFIILTHSKHLIVFGSIINCLHGFLLTLCFVCTKRVHLIMKSTFSTITSTISQSSSNTNKSIQNSVTGKIKDDKNIELK